MVTGCGVRGIQKVESACTGADPNDDDAIVPLLSSGTQQPHPQHPDLQSGYGHHRNRDPCDRVQSLCPLCYSACIAE
jgi:hypothetical protein